MVANSLRTLRLVTILCLAALPVALATSDWDAAAVLGAGVATTGAASVLGPVARSGEVSGRRRLAEVGVAWVVVAVAAGVVTWGLAMVSGAGAQALRDPWSALFESTSGVTTTGLTMVGSPAELPTVLQWWRSVLQWGGALGVVVFALLVAEPSGDRDDYLDANWSARPAEGPGAAARRIAVLLVGLTLVGVVALWATGDPLWRAVNHAMTSAATGGFTITDDSAGASSGASQVALITVALVSAVSFGTLWGIVGRKGPPLYRRTQLRFSLGLLALGAATAVLLSLGEAGIGATLFNAASASATAGFSAGDGYQNLGGVAVVTVATMFVGGAAGSTAGGVKVARVAWLAKATRRWLPEDNDLDRAPFTWDGEQVDPDEGLRRVVGAGALIGIWALGVLVLTVALLVATDTEPVDAVFEIASATSGVGLSRGLTGEGLGAPAKAVLSAAMLIGRVEFTSFVALAYVAAGHRQDREEVTGI